MNGKFPFMLGSTSYIIEDNLCQNASNLAPTLDDMELVLFDQEDHCNYPNPDEMDKLIEISEAHNFTYTPHLPVDAMLGSPDEGVRQNSVRSCLRMINIVDSLKPFAYVLHFDGDERGGIPSPDIGRWKENLKRSIEDLLADGVDPEMICVENLDYDFTYVDDIVDKYDLSICLDVGHLQFYKQDYDRHISNYLGRAKVMHMHGIRNGEDHHDIGEFDRDKLDMTLKRLRADNVMDRVVTLEMFSQRELDLSLSVLAEYVN